MADRSSWFGCRIGSVLEGLGVVFYMNDAGKLIALSPLVGLYLMLAFGPRNAAQEPFLLAGPSITMTLTTALVYNTHGMLVPEVWPERRLKFFCWGVCIFVFGYIFMLTLIEGNLHPLLLLPIQLPIVFVVFGLPSIVMMRGLQIKIFPCKQQSWFWIFLMPFAVGWWIFLSAVGVQLKAAIVIIIFTLDVLWCVLVGTHLFTQTATRNRLANTIGSAVMWALAPHAVFIIAFAVMDITGSPVATYVAVRIMSFIAVKGIQELCWVMVGFMEEATGVAGNIVKPFVSLQFGEHFVVSLIFADVSFGWEFGTLLAMNVCADSLLYSGLLSEWYARYIRRLSKERLQEYMAWSYEFNVQGAELESLSYILVFIIILMEFLLWDLFGGGLSGSGSKRELSMVLVVFLVILCVELLSGFVNRAAFVRRMVRILYLDQKRRSGSLPQEPNSNMSHTRMAANSVLSVRSRCPPKSRLSLSMKASAQISGPGFTTPAQGPTQAVKQGLSTRSRSSTRETFKARISKATFEHIDCKETLPGPVYNAQVTSDVRGAGTWRFRMPGNNRGSLPKSPPVLEEFDSAPETDVDAEIKAKPRNQSPDQHIITMATASTPGISPKATKIDNGHVRNIEHCKPTKPELSSRLRGRSSVYSMNTVNSSVVGNQTMNNTLKRAEKVFLGVNNTWKTNRFVVLLGILNGLSVVLTWQLRKSGKF